MNRQVPPSDEGEIDNMRTAMVVESFLVFGYEIAFDTFDQDVPERWRPQFYVGIGTKSTGWSR